MLKLLEFRETPKGKKTRLQTLIELRGKLQKDYKNVTVIINNPCIEFWLLRLFEKTSKFFDLCDKVETELKKHLKDYEKTAKYFTKQDNDIYLKLRPHLKTAISNTSNLVALDLKEQTKAKGFWSGKRRDKLPNTAPQPACEFNNSLLILYLFCPLPNEKENLFLKNNYFNVIKH